MASAAEVLILAQPVKAISKEGGMAWVDVFTTVRISKIARSAQEGAAILEAARQEIAQRGGQWALKTLILSVQGSRKPARLRLPKVTMVGI